MTTDNLKELFEFLKYTLSLDVFIFIINAFIFIVVAKAIQMIYKLTKNKILGIKTKPFIKTGTGEKKILILGDSTAVGTGASDPADTIGGRLASDFPNAQILNVAENGGLISNLHNQITPHENQKFDLIIISAGGNDVWHFTKLSKIKKDLILIFPKLLKMSNGRIFFLIYNNIGLAPLFPKIMRGVLTRRCNAVQNTIREATDSTEIKAIELFTKNEKNPFIDNPEGLFASDGIHPSSQGYKLWYNRMWRKIVS